MRCPHRQIHIFALTSRKAECICVVVLSNIMWQQVGSLCPVPFFLMTKCPHHWCYQSGAKLTNTVCVTLWWIRREGLLDCEVLLFAWIAFSLYILGRCSISVGKLLFELFYNISGLNIWFFSSHFIWVWQKQISLIYYY